MTKENSAYIKSLQVIDSCDTREQLQTTYNYVALALKSGRLNINYFFILSDRIDRAIKSVIEKKPSHNFLSQRTKEIKQLILKYEV